MKYLWIIVFVFYSIFLFAQEDNQDPVDLSGQVLDSENMQPIPYSHVIVKNRNLATATDDIGYFSVKVNVSDTLVFSAVGFENYQLIVKKGDDYENIEIILKPKIYTLKPVDIYAYDLNKILNKKDEKPFTMERSQGKPIFEERESKEGSAISFSPTENGGAALTGAVTAFANLFNKEFKERKKLQEILEKEKILNEIRSKEKQLLDNYKDIVQKVTGLKGKDFEKYMVLYTPDFSFLQYANDYELIVRIHENFKDFRYKYKLEEVSLNELLKEAEFSR